MSLFLHIGVGKTGTTTLQVFLEQHHEELARRGVFVARSPQSRNHRALAMHALNDEKIDNSRRAKRLTDPQKIATFREDLESRIKKEASSLPATGSLVFSSEQLTRLKEPEELFRLKELLETYKRPIKIVVYLRRQDKYIVSEYSQRIKGGRDMEITIDNSLKTQSVYDFERFLAPWDEVFGTENIIVRPFERDQLHRRDVIADFANIVGLEKYDDLDRPARQNESLDCYTLAYLRKLNSFVPRFVNEKPNKQRLALIAQLEQLSTGPKIRLGPDETQKILAIFEESNKAVAARYLQREDGDLFWEELSEEPEVVQTLDVEKSIEITAALLKTAVLR